MSSASSPSDQPQVSERVFQYFDKIDDDRGGSIRVYESSAADGPHVWLEAVSEGVAVHLHMPLLHLAILRAQCQFMEQNHYHLVGVSKSANSEVVVDPTDV